MFLNDKTTISWISKPVKSSIPSSNQASGFAMEQKCLAWEFQPGFLSEILAFFLNIHPERAIYYYFVKGSLVKPVSACSGTALGTAQLSTLWNGKKKMMSELIRLSFLCLSLVMEVLDLSLLDISIWTWEWNSSWLKTRALHEALFVRVWQWSECSGVVTDTLTLFRWL